MDFNIILIISKIEFSLFSYFKINFSINPIMLIKSLIFLANRPIFSLFLSKKNVIKFSNSLVFLLNINCILFEDLLIKNNNSYIFLFFSLKSKIYLILLFK